MIRAARAGWPALTTAVGVLVSVVATAVEHGGGSGLPVGRAAVLVVLLLAIAAVLGAIAVAMRAAVPEARRGRLLDGAAVAAVVWTLAAAATTFLLYCGIAPDPTSSAFGPGLVSFVAETDIGRTWIIATAAAAILTAFLVAIRSPRGVLVLAVLTAASVLPVALQAAETGAPIGVERSIASGTWVQLLALLTWIGAAALGGAGRLLGPVCFAAAGIATAVAAPDLVRAGATGPVMAGGALAVLLAGLIAVGTAVAHAPSRLRRLEAALLAAGIGLGAAGSVLRSTGDLPARTTPAEILTGSPLPAPASVLPLLTTWRPDALWVVVSVGLVVVHLVGRRRVGRTPWADCRTVATMVGAVLLVWLTSGGPARYQEVDLGVHLGQHLALLLVVPLLLVAGSPGLLSDPPDGLPRLPDVRPTGALLLVVLGVGALYGTDALRWSIDDPLGTEATTAACLVLGTLLVRALLRPGGSRRSAVACAIALLVAETVGAAALGTGPGLLQADWFGAMGWGTDALVAQHLGALAAWPVAAVPTAVLLVAAVRAPRTSEAALSRSTAVAA